MKRYYLTAAALAIIGAMATAWAQSSKTNAPAVPQWDTDAGGKIAFDVASVKLNNSGLPPSGDMPYSNFPLGPGDDYSLNGALFTATNLPLTTYMAFAYKLTVYQVQTQVSGLPKWANTDRFDIQARGEGTPTKDQMRLMIQSLLADRFKLAVHYDKQELPVFTLVLEKTGRLGPQLQAYQGDSGCSFEAPSFTAPNGTAATSRTTTGEMLATFCGGLTRVPSSTPGLFGVGARDVGASPGVPYAR